jgi:hypothetical protein
VLAALSIFPSLLVFGFRGFIVVDLENLFELFNNSVVRCSGRKRALRCDRLNSMSRIKKYFFGFLQDL